VIYFGHKDNFTFYVLQIKILQNWPSHSFAVRSSVHIDITQDLSINSVNGLLQFVLCTEILLTLLISWLRMDLSLSNVFIPTVRCLIYDNVYKAPLVSF